MTNSKFTSVPVLLQALGSHPTEIAESLARHGIKGKRASACVCPIARYLTKEIGEQVNVGFTSCWNVKNDETYATPNVVLAFIRLFDRGFYPEVEVL